MAALTFSGADKKTATEGKTAVVVIRANKERLGITRWRFPMNFFTVPQNNEGFHFPCFQPLSSVTLTATGLVKRTSLHARIWPLAFFTFLRRERKYLHD